MERACVTPPHVHRDNDTVHPPDTAYARALATHSTYRIIILISIIIVVVACFVLGAFFMSSRKRIARLGGRCARARTVMKFVQCFKLKIW